LIRGGGAPMMPGTMNSIGRCAAGVVGLLAGLCSGCANLSYDRLALGQAPSEYERTLPAEKSRRTDLGLCYLDDDGAGNVDAIVVFLAHDRRITGKVHLARRVSNLWWDSSVQVELRGQVDPQLAGLNAAGPTDLLRALIADLAAYRGERLATAAHRWVAAGLIRTVQRLPNVDASQLVYPDLHETLEGVPPGGTARIGVDPGGAYEFGYTQRVAR
jgi:hypothetical protein